MNKDVQWTVLVPLRDYKSTDWQTRLHILGLRHLVHRSSESTSSPALKRRRVEPPQAPIYVQIIPQPKSPVFRLPPEVLRYIFRILFDMHLLAVTAWRIKDQSEIHTEELPQPWRLPKVQHPWIVTLQICRLWRWAVPDYGGLWTDIASRWPSPTDVALPSIEHISVIDEVLCMSNFLSHFPLSSFVHHRFTIFDENSPLIANYIRHLAVLHLMSQIPSLIGGPIASLVFADDDDTNYEPFHKIEVDALVAPTSQDYLDPPALHFIFDCISHRDAHRPCLELLLCGLKGQLPSVKMIWLLNLEAYMSINWSRLLACTSALRELRISTDDAYPLVELMGSVAAEHRDEQTGITEREVYLPALEHLRISLMGRDERLFELAARVLKRRADLGSRLPVLTLRIDGDSLQPDEEVLLSRVVSSFVSENDR